MQIADTRTDGVVVVTPGGRIDTTTSPALDAHLASLVSRSERRIVVDFTGVDYISSAGLRVLLLFARRMKDTGGALALCGMGDAVHQVFQLAGFLPLFTVCPSADAAVREVTR